MRVAFLVPTRIIRNRGAGLTIQRRRRWLPAAPRSTPIAWTEAGDLSDFDLVLPLVAWGYHVDYPRWLELARPRRDASAGR